MNFDILFDIGDIVILLVLYIAMGGELAVMAYITYAIVGVVLGFITDREKPVDIV